MCAFKIYSKSTLFVFSLCLPPFQLPSSDCLNISLVTFWSIPHLLTSVLFCLQVFQQTNLKIWNSCSSMFHLHLWQMYTTVKNGMISFIRLGILSSWLWIINISTWGLEFCVCYECCITKITCELYSARIILIHRFFFKCLSSNVMT